MSTERSKSQSMQTTAGWQGNTTTQADYSLLLPVSRDSRATVSPAACMLSMSSAALPLGPHTTVAFASAVDSNALRFAWPGSDNCTMDRLYSADELSTATNAACCCEKLSRLLWPYMTAAKAKRQL